MSQNFWVVAALICPQHPASSALRPPTAQPASEPALSVFISHRAVQQHSLIKNCAHHIHSVLARVASIGRQRSMLSCSSSTFKHHRFNGLDYMSSEDLQEHYRAMCELNGIWERPWNPVASQYRILANGGKRHYRAFSFEGRPRRMRVFYLPTLPKDDQVSVPTLSPNPENHRWESESRRQS
jgi:hypothetical protein